MSSWEPVDIDHDEIADEDDKWDDDFMNDLERRFNQLKQFNVTLDQSRDEELIDITTVTENALKHDTIELVANQIYDKLTILFNNTRKRFGIQKGKPILEPLINYGNFKLADDEKISYVHKRTVIDLANINERLKPPWEICRLGVAKLKSMGFISITDEDINPYKPKYKKMREKVRILNENLNERSKAIESSSATDAEAIEMIEVTSKDIDTTVKDVEQGTFFIEPGEKDKLLPLRELGGGGGGGRLDKQLRMIKGYLKVAIAQRIDLEGRIEHEERKLNEIQDPSYSDDQRNTIDDRIRKLKGELNERNKEIDILKGEASKQINQIRGSITKFLDKESGMLAKRIRTLFKEQG